MQGISFTCEHPNWSEIQKLYRCNSFFQKQLQGHQLGMVQFSL